MSESVDRGAVCELLDRHTTFVENGFSVDLEPETLRWRDLAAQLGAKELCRIMSGHLCARFRERSGREFLFSDECVAYELEYHLRGYLWARGYGGWGRHITTWLLPRSLVLARCKEIDISSDDIASLPQLIVFRYRKGIRESYKNTPDDPFRKKRKRKNKS
ncbi:MAG: hypothetical protein IKE57_04425 [Oscillospiraceae bacterium]|nr:hypothetical protein [Oscillospiraceae bacterium]